MSWKKPARPVRSSAQRQALIQIGVAPRDLGVERALRAGQFLEGHGGERQVGADVVGGGGGADDEAFHSLAGGAAEFGRPGGGGFAFPSVSGYQRMISYGLVMPASTPTACMLPTPATRTAIVRAGSAPASSEK